MFREEIFFIHNILVSLVHKIYTWVINFNTQIGILLIIATLTNIIVFLYIYEIQNKIKGMCEIA